ncbi:MAG: hypothetical protein ACFB6S_07300 [Geminicoccaceae bacterium]
MAYSLILSWPATAAFSLALVLMIALPQPGLSQQIHTYREQPSAGDRSPQTPNISGPGEFVGVQPYDDAGVLRVIIGDNVALPSKPRFYGVTAIAIQETTDEPCKVELWGTLLDPESGSDDRLLATAKLAGCEGGRKSNWRAATLAGLSNQFVREVQMCHPVSDITPWSPITPKLKGLSVSAAAVLDGAEVIDLPTMPCIKNQTNHCFVRANCGQWSNRAACPSGQIVVGVNMYTYAENNRPPDAFYGIEPICRKVGRRPQFASGLQDKASGTGALTKLK